MIGPETQHRPQVDALETVRQVRPAKKGGRGRCSEGGLAKSSREVVPRLGEGTQNFKSETKIFFLPIFYAVLKTGFEDALSQTQVGGKNMGSPGSWLTPGCSSGAESL